VKKTENTQFFISITQGQYNRLQSQGKIKTDTDGRTVAKINSGLDYVPIKIEGEPDPVIKDESPKTVDELRKAAGVIRECRDRALYGNQG
jgi:hypothetical protein